MRYSGLLIREGIEARVYEAINTVVAQFGITGEGISDGIAAAVQFSLVLIPEAVTIAVIGAIAILNGRRHSTLRRVASEPGRFNLGTR